LTNSIKHKGFTLIELLVVVAIIGILSAVGVVAYNGYTSSAKKKVVLTQYDQTIKYVKAEVIKCDIGSDTVMDGHLKCSEKLDNDKIANGVRNAFDQKFNNPYKSWRENAVAVASPPVNLKCGENHGKIDISNRKSGSKTLVRIAACTGDPTALLTEFLIE
tara:strand:- start:109 stop:591 length:483 start_codon:yes stop_codon:yes gene_type:complete